jgi:hypothetical protein
VHEAVLVPVQMLAGRRRPGPDGRDEVWHGVLHVALDGVAGGVVPSEETGPLRSGDDSRVPDPLLLRPEQAPE